MSRRAAVLGLGTRGISWARTCLEAGWDVRAFDPLPDCAHSLSSEPGFRREATISGTVSRADWVFCCLPERLELVQMVLQRAQAEAPKSAVLAVTSRQYDVDALQSCAIRPGHVFRVDESVAGGVALDVTDRNGPDLRDAAERTFAELAAVRSLYAPDIEPDQPAGAESA